MLQQQSCPHATYELFSQPTRLTKLQKFERGPDPTRWITWRAGKALDTSDLTGLPLSKIGQAERDCAASPPGSNSEGGTFVSHGMYCTSTFVQRQMLLDMLLT
jgi:hypothetical protein